MTEILTQEEIDDLLTAIDSCHLTDCRFWDKEENLNCRKKGERSSCYESKKKYSNNGVLGMDMKLKEWLLSINVYDNLYLTGIPNSFFDLLLRYEFKYGMVAVGFSVCKNRVVINLFWWRIIVRWGRD
jgi:hypothetical protein